MVIIHHSKEITKIIVENNFEKNEAEEFFDAVKISKRLEVLFVNVKIISAKIAKNIVLNKEKLIIESTEKSLWSYLHKLGVIARYKNTVIDKVSVVKASPKVVVFGGGEESIEEISKIIPRLPYADISVFILIHLKHEKESHLAQIWDSLTNYKVLIARNGLIPKPNHIYIVKPSINVTFESLSEKYKEYLLAILLGGYKNDNVDFLTKLRANNSTIVIQNPGECEDQEILLDAIISENYNCIFTIEQIISYIRTLFVVNVDLIDEMNIFFENIMTRYGYDFRNYDKGSLSRRINQIMKEFGIVSFKDFELMVLENEDIFDIALKEFSINVTSFFRNPLVFKTLRDTVLQELATYPHIRIWCAGCSRGDEPYSVAIMLAEAGLLKRSQIYATDFNSVVIGEAENGLYGINEYQTFKSNYIESGGKMDFDKWFDIQETYVEVNQEIKNKILFFRHNLATDKSINEFHLILCRNVMIYFDNQLRKRVFNLFDSSLERNGFLVLGESETLNSDFSYQPISKAKNKIYQKNTKIEFYN